MKWPAIGLWVKSTYGHAIKFSISNPQVYLTAFLYWLYLPHTQYSMVFFTSKKNKVEKGVRTSRSSFPIVLSIGS